MPHSSPAPSQTGPIARHRRRFSQLVLLAAAGLWALTWSSFVIASVQGEPWRGWVIGAAMCVSVWSLALGAWWKPRVGGLVMAGFGIWAATFFNARAAMLGLSAPAVVLGLGFLLFGVSEARRRRRALRAMILARTNIATPVTPSEAAASPEEA